MAKPKTKVLVEIVLNQVEPIRIWVSNAKAHLNDIASVEGVTHISLHGSSEVSVMIDKRYDKNEIAQELRELLTAEVPSIFREEDE